MFRRSAVAAVAVTTMALGAIGGGTSQADTTTPGSATRAGIAAGATDVMSMGVLAKYTKLKDNKPLRFKTPGAAGHSYSYDTTTAYWSVIAALPIFNVDVDLHVYADKARTDLLAESVVASGSVDFVAIDSGHRALDSQFVQVDKVENHGTYRVELAQSSKYAVNGYQNVPMLGKNFVTVFDTLLEAGKNYRFVLAPTAGDMNGGMFLMASNPDDSSTWVQSRDQYVRWADAPSGEATVFDFTPSRTDRYGLVVVSTGAPGTFGLTRINF